MSRTSIEWTEETWNPIRGCSRISPGCENCYAERHASRFSGPGLPFEGFASGGHWTRKVSLLGGDSLLEPLRWRTHRRVFLSMSDLFHEALSEHDLDRVFAVMAICAMHEERPSHTFQILTKREERMFRYVAGLSEGVAGLRERIARVGGAMMEDGDGWHDKLRYEMPWPLPNVWLGVSVEDQEYADLRIPKLLSTPAAVRFVSYEPALGPVNFAKYLRTGMCTKDGPREHWDSCTDPSHVYPRLDWGIGGGESGPGARPNDIGWQWSMVRQFQEAGVPCFIKQLGRRPYGDAAGTGLVRADRLVLAHRKGGDPAEWPEGLRVRQYPKEAA